MVMLDVWFLVSSGFATFISGIVVGVALVRSLRSYDGKTIVVIGHGATRFGIEYWCGDASLEEIVRGPWEWREVPIWRYELSAHDLEQRTVARHE